MRRKGKLPEAFCAAILAFRSCGVPLWFLEIRKDPIVKFLYDKRVIGDRPNSAAFFVEQYYDPTRSVRELVPLAAHTILMGHARNGLAVEGLEMLLCENRDDITEWTAGAPELEALKMHSDCLDSDIRARLLTRLP